MLGLQRQHVCPAVWPKVVQCEGTIGLVGRRGWGEGQGMQAARPPAHLARDPFNPTSDNIDSIKLFFTRVLQVEGMEGKKQI